MANVTASRLTVDDGAITWDDMTIDGILTASGLTISGAATFDTDVTFDGDTAGQDLMWDASSSGGSLIFDDNAKAKFGDGGDLEIHHNGNDSYISAVVDGRDLYIQTTVDRAVHFRQNSGERITLNVDDTITLTGNVGIGGTSTALSNTNLYLTGATTAEVHIQTTGATSYPILRFKNVDGSSNVGHWAISVRGNDSNKLRIFDEGTQKGLIVQTSGEVGLGTTTPLGRIHVKETARANTAYFQRDAGSSTLSSPWIAARLNVLTSGAWNDGGGPALEFTVTDGGVTNQNLGYLQMIRDGADNTAKFSIFMLRAGNSSTPLTLKSTGQLDITATTDHAVIRALGSNGNMAAQFGSTNNDEGYMDLADGGSTKVRIAANMSTYFTGGNVGIGTTAPASLFALGSARSAWKTINFQDNDNSNAIQAYVASYNTGASDGFLRLNGLNNMQFRTGDTDRMYIDSSGNVGIGTASPAAPFDIASASADTNSFLTESSDSGQGPTMMVRRARGSSLSSPTAIQNSNHMGKFSFAGHDGGGYDEGPMIRAATSETWSASAHGSYLSFWTVDNTTTTQDERMRINHDGTVGIGTIPTNSSFYLDILGASGTAPRVRLKSQGSDDAHLTIDAANDIYLQFVRGGTYKWAMTNNVTGAADSWSLYDYPSNLHRIVVDQTGKVGIGTATPMAGTASNSTGKLEIEVSRSPVFDADDTSTWEDMAIHNTQNGAGVAAGIGFHLNSNYHSNAGTGIAAVKASGDDYDADMVFVTRGDSVGATEKMRILHNGKVGIGTASPASYHSTAQNLVVYSTGATGITLAAGTSSNSAIYFADGTSSSQRYRGFMEYAHSTDSLHLGTAGSTRLTIDSSGNGTFGGNVTAYSDARLKENITTIDSALEKVNKMRGVTYDRIDQDYHGAGVLAQELEEVAPELVQDGKYKSVAYGNLTAYLVEAIKELKQKVEDLENGTDR